MEDIKMQCFFREAERIINVLDVCIHVWLILKFIFVKKKGVAQCGLCLYVSEMCAATGLGKHDNDHWLSHKAANLLPA
jgi:hypothetical protein